jgi:aspartyl protease family protein
MSTSTVKVRVWNPERPTRVEEMDLLMDTGASYSWISRERLESLGVKAVRSMQFRTIEGTTLERDLAPVYLATDGFMGGDNVVMANPGDMEVLGAHSLESLGITVDPVEMKLVPTIGLALSHLVVGPGRKS